MITDGLSDYLSICWVRNGSQPRIQSNRTEQAHAHFVGNILAIDTLCNPYPLSAHQRSSIVGTGKAKNTSANIEQNIH